MRAVRYFLLCNFVFLQLSVAGEAPRIYHIPPKDLTLNKACEITCVVSPGECHLQRIRIFLRTDTTAIYKEFAMQYRDGLWVLPLIPEMVQGENLFYFITAEFTDLAAVAFPSEKPSENPVKVPLIRPKTKKK